jgi:hypothetical protein
MAAWNIQQRSKGVSKEEETAGFPWRLSGAGIFKQRHGSVCQNLFRAVSWLPGQIIANKIGRGRGTSYNPFVQ